MKCPLRPWEVGFELTDQGATPRDTATEAQLTLELADVAGQSEGVAVTVRLPEDPAAATLRLDGLALYEQPAPP